MPADRSDPTAFDDGRNLDAESTFDAVWTQPVHPLVLPGRGSIARSERSPVVCPDGTETAVDVGW